MKELPGAGISLLLSKSINGAARFNFPIIAIDSTCAFTTNALWRDLGFNSGKFWMRDLIGLGVSVFDY